MQVLAAWKWMSRIHFGKLKRDLGLTHYSQMTFAQ